MYKSLQAYSDVFDVIPSPPHAIEMVSFPVHGIAAVDLDPSPAIRVLDKGGNVISTAFQGLIYKAAGFGFLRQRQNLLTSASPGGVPNIATFSNTFFDSSSTPLSYALGFNASFPGGITVNAIFPGVAITDKIKYGEFQEKFLQLPNQTASIPFTVQPMITLRDRAEAQVKAAGAQIEVTASLRNGGATGATLQGSTIIKSVNGVAAFTDLAIDKTGSNYSIRFSFISCDSDRACASQPFVCSKLSDFCASTYTTATLHSSSFNINVGFASTLSIVVQPSAVVAGVAINPAPVIRILDLGGNTVISAATVSVRLEENEKGAALLSSPEQMLVSAVEGIATFTALYIDKTGTSFRIIFSSTNAAAHVVTRTLQAISNPVAVTAAPIVVITVTVQPGTKKYRAGFCLVVMSSAAET